MIPLGYLASPRPPPCRLVMHVNILQCDITYFGAGSDCSFSTGSGKRRQLLWGLVATRALVLQKPGHLQPPWLPPVPTADCVFWLLCFEASFVLAIESALFYNPFIIGITQLEQF